ncbi:hypothetical protein VD0004_g5103 [Verticillium dahliae]|uniref:ATPase inhibitor, mitochondrial n=1 Tax=Verticillium dahliae TaxID=27337 RepID=A0AA44WJG5_VERDA|nr:hypothetical protein BJF96_g4739 [Verticillium dahliae]PNH42124.1 hypothetical protein VD0004_g5103 [Verticillium dahliae]PNH53125.1 hypothetical protein VD0003_g4247 [Verticillium dahliae]
MLRTVTSKAIRAPLYLASRATFTTTARAMADGDLGSVRSTGGQGDAFQQREKAAEDYAIRQREKEKLQEMKQKIKEQQAHLQQLADHMFVPKE